MCSLPSFRFSVDLSQEDVKICVFLEKSSWKSLAVSWKSSTFASAFKNNAACGSSVRSKKEFFEKIT